MSTAASLDCLASLPRTPASAVKKNGWRGVMRTLDAQGKILITNHNDPEAVILSTREYTALMQAVQLAQSNLQTPLEALQRKFDERLSILNSPDAGDRLRSLMDQPATLEGQVKAGTGY